MQLDDLGVTEMTESEMEDVDGGIIPALIIGAIILLWPTPAY